ncbi:MAG: hypothetical protein QOI84_829, partial [Solirubrobacterales bacterium]|nr:hypothetical protein [Solirubrobacterales bacterium]
DFDQGADPLGDPCGERHQGAAEESDFPQCGG